MDRNIHQRQIDSPKLDLRFINQGYLFDRQSEIEKIYEAFYRCIEPGAQSELILISGISGTGKTVLANKLQEPVELKGGYFISGKFDQMQKPQQYSAFASAFADFVRLLLMEGPNAVEEKKQIILKDIGADNRLLVETFPVLKNIIGTAQYDGTKIMGQAIQSRLELAVGKFVTAICSNESPLAVLMDDLQWADSGSLELLESLVSNKRIEGLVVAGVCRSNNVPWGHAFAAMLRRLEEKKDTLISHIIVESLSWESANHVVSHALQASTLSCKPITDILVARTKGNIFFLLQLLQEFYNDSILEYYCSQDLWTLNAEKLRVVAKDQDVVDLIVEKITKMPDKTQTVLMSGACLGATFDLALLSKVLDGVDVLNAIQIAIEKNIVNYDEQLNRCTFSHDQMQQAAYALIADSEKPLVHLTIGRRLLEKIQGTKLLDHIFLVTDQMVRGSSLLENREEKNQLAALCLRAGTEAARSGDFKSASVHFWQGIGLFGERHWRDEYDLSLELYSSVAETEYCIAGFEKMDKAVEEVLTNGRSSTDKLRAHSAKIYLLWAQGNSDESVDLGIFVLNSLGVEFPTKIGKVHVLCSILKTKFLLRRMSNSDFLAIGDMEDPKMIAAMGIMNHLITYTGVIRPNLCLFLATQIMQMSLKYGICVISAYGISAYGVLLNIMGDYENGYRIGRISLSILNRYQNSTRWVPRVYTTFYAAISPWTRPVSMSLDPLLEAYDLGIKNGDIEAAMLAVRFYAMLAFFSGAPLSQMTEKLNCHADEMEKFNQRTFLLGTNLQLNLIKCFTGAISDNIINELASEDILHEQKSKKYHPFNAQHKLWTLIVAYHFGNIDIALKAVILIPQHEKWFRMCILSVMKIFYHALISLEAAWIQPTPHKQRKHNISVAKDNRKKLQKLSMINPKNCTNKLLLLDAELAVLRGDRADFILDMYDKAISVAGVEGFIHEQALASERAGLFMRRRGDDSGSQKYFNRAVVLYKEWGATRKVAHMLDTNRSSC